jgi:tetratricopeptide (TPR) repeat protein
MSAPRLAIPLALALLGAAGCDSLSARHRARAGYDAYLRGDYHEAHYKFEQALALDPHLDALHLNLAYTYMQLHALAPTSTSGTAYGGLAVREFEAYLERKPDDQTARKYLVQTFVDTGRYDDAVAWFKPETADLEAISTLGQIAAKTNRFDKAVHWYEQRAQRAPKDPDAHYNLGVLLWEHLHNHPELPAARRLELADKGLAALRTSVDLRPRYSDTFTYSNLIYRERALSAADDAARAADLALADENLKKALDLKKAGP